MIRWTRKHFVLPYLAASVGVGTRPGEIELRDGERAMTLAIEGDTEAAASLLIALTQPGSDAWAQLGDVPPPALFHLVTDLDRFGWLREGDESGRTRRDLRVARLDALVARARSWLNSAGSTVSTPADNLAAAALARCRTVWRRSSPLTDQILKELLDGESPQSSGWDSVATAVCDPADIENQVWAALQLVVMSRSSGLSSRYRRFVSSSMEESTGINILVTAEQCAVALLADLGEPDLNRLIAEPGGARRAAPMIFQHRWFETIRYVESATRLLRFRLGADLRELVVHYLREEMGHEVHELNLCLQLGITRSDLARFAPLAFFAAYPELLAELAESRPLSFLLAMTVAEGLPGSGRRLTELLADQGIGASMITAHDDLDQQLNHEMVTRTLLAQLDWVSASAAAEATSDLLLLVDIAHAGWQMLSRYVTAGLPNTPQPFAITADVVEGLCCPPR